jgi:hypothetical protein
MTLKSSLKLITSIFSISISFLSLGISQRLRHLFTSNWSNVWIWRIQMSVFGALHCPCAPHGDWSPDSGLLMFVPILASVPLSMVDWESIRSSIDISQLWRGKSCQARIDVQHIDSQDWSMRQHLKLVRILSRFCYTVGDPSWLFKSFFDVLAWDMKLKRHMNE